MSTCKTLHQDIERLKKKVDSESTFSIEELKDIYEEGIFIQESLSEMIPEISKDDLIKIVHAIAETDQMIYKHIYFFAKNDSGKARKWLENKVNEFEKKIRYVLGNIKLTPSVVAAYLQNYSSKLLSLKHLAVYIEEGKYQSILPDVFSEVHYLVTQIAERQNLLNDAFISEKLNILRFEALRREVTVFSEEVERVLHKEKHDILQLWKIFSWGNIIQANMMEEEESHKPLIESCNDCGVKLRESLFQRIEECPDEKKFSLLDKFALDLHERADEALVNSEDIILSAAIKSLVNIRDSTLWLRKYLKKVCAGDEVPETLKVRYRALCKIDRRLRHEIQEKKLQQRLERIFGKKFVSFFENLILFLILAVIALLIIESTAKLSLRTLKIFMIIDTFICSIFLLEFFTKLFLAEGKILYFLRHFIIDLLPSIPFGLLTHVQNLHYARSARIARFLRLPRLIRYVRVARPLIRIFRVIIFLLRGTDRLINSYARWLNRNIIFFGSQDELEVRLDPSIKHKIQELRGICLGRSRTIFQQATDEACKPFVISYLSSLEIRLQKSQGGTIVKETLLLSPDILVEDVLNTLLHIKGNQVEDIMGREFPYRIYKYISLLNAPIIRSLPGIKSLVRHHKEFAPPTFAAWLIKGFGRIIERGLAIVYWFTDLYGIVTGPRLLDKVSNTMINSFKRPAKRLLIIGGVFLLCNLLLSQVNIPILQKLVSILDRIVGKPLIILGGICLVPLGIGMWLRNIAGEATEFYERTAEAQFINLLKDLKLYNAREDIEILYDRVLHPEIMLTKHKDDEESLNPDTFITQLQEELMSWNAKEKSLDTRVTTRQEAKRWKLKRQVMLLYKDYLDGAPLHKSDVKTTEQLLGNITLNNVRLHRLGYSKKDFKELDKLDLNKHRIFTGPYLWFSLITQSLAHNTAQLIVEYNKNIISESTGFSETDETKALYRNWLDKRLCNDDPEKLKKLQELAELEKLEKKEVEGHKRKKRKRKKRKDAVPVYLTTQFTALHFLTSNKSQDETIRLQFGEELYQALLKDRKDLIKIIFGTFPLQQLPRPQRSLNIYQLYQEHMAGGRIFTLPLKSVWWFFKGIGIGFSWFYKKIKEILNPVDINSQPIVPCTDFNVAIRKINRMRKPVFMACMKLRAQFDFEYLGLHLPGKSRLSSQSSVIPDCHKSESGSLYEKDLAYIRALDSDYDFFRELRMKRKKQLRSFGNYLKQNGWSGDGLEAYLHSINPSLADKKDEILRALAIAYTIDYRRVASLINARETIEDVFKPVIKRRGKIKGYSFFKHIFVLLYRFIKTFAFAKTDWEREAFEEFWQDIEYDNLYGKEEKKWCWKAYLANRTALVDVLYFIKEEGDIAIIEEILKQVIFNPTSWTEELISVRTIQTLSIMDVQNYRRHVAHIGEYPEREFYSNTSTL